MWVQHSTKYVNATVKTVEEAIVPRKITFVTKAKKPYPSEYHPELDESPEYNDSDVRFCHEMVGMLRSAVELGRVDIFLEVLLTSSYMACPRIVHMKILIHISAFLKSKPKLTIAFDLRHLVIEKSRFVKCN